MNGALWPRERLGEALVILARRGGLRTRDGDAGTGGSGPPEEGFDRWLDATVERLGIEAEAVEAPYADVAGMLEGAAPALLAIDEHFALLVGGGRGRLRLIGPDLRERTVPTEVVRARLCAGMEDAATPTVDRVLDEAAIAPGRRPVVREAMLRQVLGAWPVRGCTLLRPGPAAPVGDQAREIGLGGRLAALVALQAAAWGGALLAWWTIGRGALSGHLDAGWIVAWALLLLSGVPVQVLATWTEGRLAIGAGALLKRRLLHGALGLSADTTRAEGAGTLLGRVVEAQAVETLGLAGGFAAGLAALELATASAVLLAGAGGGLHVALFVAWIAVAAGVLAANLAARLRWTDARLALTGDAVERMVGHRTRVVQEARERWHDGEDAALDAYLDRSVAVDRTLAAMTALLARGWMVLGIAGLAPAFVAGTASATSLAVGLGGVLLGGQALGRVSGSVGALGGAWVAWRRVRPLVVAGAPGAPGDPRLVARAQAAEAVLDARDVRYRYGTRPEPVLAGVSLRIGRDDRLLLEGASGGGKSTFGAILAGLRSPDAGMLLLGGLDRPSLGDREWRRRVGAAPQFHENHVLGATFAFNLLMGRRWPAPPEDLAEAETVCRELGLGPLIDRMPGGLMQMVGESGWQLSHGERSRLFVARALLQRADLLVLDESFASLDPENLALALDCVRRRAPALLVIAHP